MISISVLATLMYVHAHTHNEIKLKELVLRSSFTYFP